MQPVRTGIPKLRRGCRLSPASAPESLLLIPEGALRLQGPGRRIIELCDGQRSLGDVIGHLQAEYRSAESSQISREVTTFLEGLEEKGAIEFV
jgi:pyrroloquinoline quinone biosynthesis protein D